MALVEISFDLKRCRHFQNLATLNAAYYINNNFWHLPTFLANLEHDNTKYCKSIAEQWNFLATVKTAILQFSCFVDLRHTCKRSFASTDLLFQHLQMQNPFPLSRFEEKKHFSTNQQRILRPWLMGLVMEITLSLLLPMLYKDSKVCRFNLSSRQ